MSSTKTSRLIELCDKAQAQLDNAAKLLKAVKANDAASPNAVAWLKGMCRTISYEGDVLCVPMDNIFVELEEMQADEVFGEREEEEIVELTAEPPKPVEDVDERLKRVFRPSQYREPTKDSLHPEGF